MAKSNIGSSNIKKTYTKKVKRSGKTKKVDKKDYKEKLKRGSIKKRRIKKGAPSFVRAKENPVILPEAEHNWESWQTFNPGVVLLDNKVHFLYRAIGEDGISRLGYAVSSNGFTIDERLPYPVYEHEIKERTFNIYSYFSGGSFGGAEDPRIVRVDEEDVLYMTYTACDGSLRVALTSIKVNDFLNKRWKWRPHVMISPLGEVHKNWVIFPEKINGKYAILHSLSPKILIDYFDTLEFDGSTYINSYYNGKPCKEWDNGWEGWIKGTGPPPIKTKYGWLVFYHAMRKDDFSKYKVGAMLLGLDDPTKILTRLPEPVLEPEKDYENNGFKAGVVYASGAVVKDGTLLIYYGGADSYVCVAYADLEEFLEALIKGMKPALKQRSLKKRK